MGIIQKRYSLNNVELFRKYCNDLLVSFVDESKLEFNIISNNYNFNYARKINTKNGSDFYNLVNKDEGDRLYTNGVKQKQYHQILKEIKLKRKNDLIINPIKKLIFV